MNKAYAMAMDAELEHIKRESQGFAPVDTGRLRNSGQVQKVTVRGNLIQGVVGFSTEYAAIVHERGSKFLQRGISSATRGHRQRVDAKMFREVK